MDGEGGGDYGAHGDFDSRARSNSWQFWLNSHPKAVAATGLGLAGAAVALLVGLDGD